MIICKNLNQAFVLSLNEIWNNGCYVKSRGSEQREVLFHSVMIKDPTDLSIEVPARRFNVDYAITEWLWYLSRNPKVNNIGKLANIWNLIKDDSGECESNYGCYLLGDQWEWVKAELIKDKDSRRASLAINQPYHKGKNVNDYPCTQYLQFFIRDRKLHLSVNMRSNDAVFGFCNDVFTFCMFQQLMLNDLNANLPADQQIELGNYFHHAGSFHLYKNHWEMLDKIQNRYYVKTSKTGWPSLNKWKLHGRIITDSKEIKEITLPEKDMEKEDILQFTKKIKGSIYV